jgi:hypothetical protein
MNLREIQPTKKRPEWRMRRPPELQIRHFVAGSQRASKMGREFLFLCFSDSKIGLARLRT